MQQLSIFMENSKGSMKNVLGILAKAGINVLGIVANDSAEFGILRMIVSDIEEAHYVLQNEGYISRISQVIGIELEDKPGKMEEFISLIDKMNINVNYMYIGFNRETNMPITVFNSEAMAEVKETLEQRGYKVY